MVVGEGGWTFLNACQDKHGACGRAYTRQSKNCFCSAWQLQGEMPTAREVWPMLPGGLPYFAIE